MYKGSASRAQQIAARHARWRKNRTTCETDEAGTRFSAMRDVTMPKEFDGAEKKKKTLNTHAYIYTIIITYHTRTLNVMVLNVMILFVRTGESSQIITRGRLLMAPY